jgi:hypothetical protein
MKVFMRVHHVIAFGFVVFFGTFGFSKSGLADPVSCIEPSDQEKLAAIKGDYIASNLLNAILKEKNVFQGQIGWDGGFSEIKVSPGRGHKISKNHGQTLSYVSGTTWHEGEWFSEDGVERCLMPLPENKIILKEEGQARQTYKKIPQSAEKYLFAKLLNGCYASDEDEKICFDNGSIEIDGQKKQAVLILDSSELADEGNYLKVDGETLFWVLVPNEKGWNLYQSDWASSDSYVPIDLQNPWKVLTRISTDLH